MIEIIAPRLTKVAQPVPPDDDMGLDEDLSNLAPKRPPPPQRPDADNIMMADDEDFDVAPAPIAPTGAPGAPAAPPPAPPPPPAAPEPEAPVEPGLEHEEVEPEEPVDPTENMDIRRKVWYAMENNLPLRITYTALETGFVTDRTVAPIEVFWAGTHRHIMVAWCYLRNDWRAFAVDRISEAEIEREGA